MMGMIRLFLVGLAAGVAVLATLPLLLLGTPFWLASGLARGIRAVIQRWRSPPLEWGDVIEYTPVIGWQNRGSLRARIRHSRTFSMRTDEEGWRGRSTIEDSDLVVLGDSFAFGYGVGERQFFADRSSSVRMKALGANGYNMVQELLWMERLKPRLAGKLVAWLVYYGNDLLDNLHPTHHHYRTPFVRAAPPSGTWEIVTSHVRPDLWSFSPRARDWGYSDKVAEVCCPSYQAERAYAAAAFLLDRGREVLAAAGARLAVVGIPDVQTLDSAGVARLRKLASDPHRFDPALPDRRMSAICGERDIPFLALSRTLTPADHLPGDCHWNGRGHGRVAKALEQLYRSAGDPNAERPMGATEATPLEVISASRGP
jgi:hypothetical protein